MSKRHNEPKVSGMQRRYTVRVGDSDDKQISEFCDKTGYNPSDLFREAVKRMINDKNGGKE